MNGKQFWCEFLQIYKNLPVLWRVRGPYCKNYILKARAYEKLIKKMKEIQPDANIDTVVRQIKSFRNGYRKILRKVKESQKSGAAEIYQPKLWYFDKLHFLQDQEQCHEEKKSNMEYTAESDAIENSDMKESKHTINRLPIINDTNDRTTKNNEDNTENIHTYDLPVDVQIDYSNDYDNDKSVASNEINFNTRVLKKYYNKRTTSQTDELTDFDDCNEDKSKFFMDCDNDESEVLIAIEQWRSLDDPNASSAFFKNLSKNSLSLEKCISVLEAHDRKHSFSEISRMFDCSWIRAMNIVKNRDSILRAYVRTDSDRNVNNYSAQSFNMDFNYKSYLKKCVKIINMAKRYKMSHFKLKKLFNCSLLEIRHILKNRVTILEKYKATGHWLDLHKRVEVIKLHCRENFSHNDLSKIFNCTESEIRYILENSDEILKTYGKKISACFINGLTLNENLDIIKAVDCYLDRDEICDMFQCSQKQIDNCLLNRDDIQEIYMKTQNELSLLASTKPSAIADHTKESSKDLNMLSTPNDNLTLTQRGDPWFNGSLQQTQNFENIKISSLKEASIALKPLDDYAKRINNSTAINLVKLLEEHLQDNIIARQPKIVEAVVESESSSQIASVSRKLSAYENILIALKPVEDYVKLKNNHDAISVMSQLEEHLKTKLKS